MLWPIAFSGLHYSPLWALFWGREKGGSLQSVSLQGGWEVEGVVRSMEAGASMGAGFGVSLLLITAASHCEGAQDLIALSGEKLLPCP